MPLRAISWVAVSTAAQADDERASIPAQIADNAEVAKKLDLTITDTMIVPGHSRRYLDIHELARDARAENIDAFDRLIKHFKDKDYDVLIVRDGDRFARSQALHAYIVESVINGKARIYSLADGWVDENNYRMFIALGGYRAAGEIDNLLKRAKIGKIKRAEKGIPGGNATPISHLIERDKLGKPIRVVLRPNMESFWQDLAMLLVTGKSWSSAARQMYYRGHRHPDSGAMLRSNHLRRHILQPFVWGKSFYGGKGLFTTWPFNPASEPPPGLTPIHDPELPIPVVYGEEFICSGPHGIPITVTQLKQVLIELEALEQQVKQTGLYSRSEAQHPLSGILRCATCGSFLRYKQRTFRNGSKLYQYVCAKGDLYAGVCSDQARIKESLANQQVNEFLQYILYENEDTEQAKRVLSAELKSNPAQDDNPLLLIKADIARTQQEYHGLIRDRANTQSPRQLATLDLLISEQESKLDKLESLLKAQIQQTSNPYNEAAKQESLDTLRELPALSTFWEWQPSEINRMLRTIIGKQRFIVKDKQIIDLR